MAGRLPGTRSIHGPSFGQTARGRPHLSRLPEGISATFPEPFGEDARNVPQFPSDRPLGSQGFPRRGARRIPETGEAQAPAHGSNHGSRSAVLRRRDGTCFSSRSDDEVGGFCDVRARQSAGGDCGTTLFRSVSSDEDGGNRANIAASGASDRTLRDPPRASSASEAINPSELGERGNQRGISTMAWVPGPAWRGPSRKKPSISATNVLTMDSPRLRDVCQSKPDGRPCPSSLISIRSRPSNRLDATRTSPD